MGRHKLKFPNWLFFAFGLILLLIAFKLADSEVAASETAQLSTEQTNWLFPVTCLGLLFILIGIIRVFVSAIKTIVKRFKRPPRLSDGYVGNPINESKIEKAQISEPPTQVTPVACDAEAVSIAFAGNEMLVHAVDAVMEYGACTVSMLQRRLKIGYSAAARLVDQMEELGIVGPYNGASPRQLVISREALGKIKANMPQEVEPRIDEQQILRDEDEWLRKQRGLTPIEHELYKIDFMEGDSFEHWCAGLLQKVGFYHVEVTKGSNDQGVDILARKDGVKYAIQCKRYSSDLGNTPIQEVNAGKTYYKCHVGVVMTNSHFTKGAKDLAEKTETLLWDRDYITYLLGRSFSENTGEKDEEP